MFLGLLVLITLCGCVPESTDITSGFNLPNELKDYKLFELNDGNGRRIYIVVKTNKLNKTNEANEVIGVAYPQGKTVGHTITVDGETYGRIEK